MSDRTSKIAVVLAILLAVGKVSLDRHSKPAVTLDWRTIAGTTDDPCSGKATCVGIYISPWCSHCQGSIPFVQQVRERMKDSQNVGFRIIIGHDRPERMQAMAKNVQGSVILDDDQTLYRKLGIDSVPRWVVWNSDQKVINQVKGSVEGRQSAPAMESFLHDYLKIQL